MNRVHTYDYGIIGNGNYIAHVAKKDANISWLCWPRMDSSFIFGGLLDDEKGGEFRIAPAHDDYTSTQEYIRNTNVLKTKFSSNEGEFEVTDFAPRFGNYERYYKPLMLVRKIHRISGNPSVRVSCSPTANYGTVTAEKVSGSNHIEYYGLNARVRLTTNIPIPYVSEEKSFILDHDCYLVLTYGKPLEAPLEDTAESLLRKTILYWQAWVRHTNVGSFYQDHVLRSALCLKLHQYEDTGGIVASSTSSLPESPGSGRNWDYRYCWVRDSYYVLNAFNNIGHFDELISYFSFIKNIVYKEKDRYQPLYSILGEKDLTEHVLDLKGYQGNNGPVRLGNQAYEHIQNDVYGQVLVSLLPLFIDARLNEWDKMASTELIHKTLGNIYHTLDQPDAGLWEFRNLKQYHCYTYLFHWAGACSAYKIGKFINDRSMMKKARFLIKESSAYIEKCYDPKRGVYTQAIGTSYLDASCLQLITMSYLNPRSPKARKHLEVLEGELKSQNSCLFYRYKHEDDFGKPETTFLFCAFWYVEALASVGRIKEAITNFEELLKYTNHLGLLSEDVDEKDGSQWGNFPQAYSHVGQLNAAFRISRALNKPLFL